MEVPVVEWFIAKCRTQKTAPIINGSAIIWLCQIIPVNILTRRHSVHHPYSLSSQPVRNMGSLVRRLTSKVAKVIMKSHHFRIPKYDMPIRLRPVITMITLTLICSKPLLQWFLVFSCFIMVLLAFLGFTNFSRSLPLNDKLLHFLCFCIATGVFYFIIDVEEYAVNVGVSRNLLKFIITGVRDEYGFGDIQH